MIILIKSPDYDNKKWTEADPNFGLVPLEGTEGVNSYFTFYISIIIKHD